MDGPLFQTDVVFDSARAARFQEMASGYLDAAAGQAQRLQRARRLASLGSVSMFPCGSVITSVGELGAFLTPVVAVVTEEDFVIVPADPGEDVDVEYGRVSRADVTAVDVYDADRQPVSEEVLRSDDLLMERSFVLQVSLEHADPMTLILRSAGDARRGRDRFREWMPAPR